MAEIKDLHPNLSTDLSVFTLKIELQNLLFSIDFTELRHTSSIICYFPGMICILEKICPDILKEVANF